MRRLSLILLIIHYSSAFAQAPADKLLILAQDTVRYTGSNFSNADYHHGQLSPAIGVHNIQTMRANRSDNNQTTSWTYNHAPMLAYRNNTFYLEYLSNPVGNILHPDKRFCNHQEMDTTGQHRL